MVTSRRLGAAAALRSWSGTVNATSSGWLMTREMAELTNDSSGKSIGMRGRRLRERTGVRSIEDDLCAFHQPKICRDHRDQDQEEERW